MSVHKWWDKQPVPQNNVINEKEGEIDKIKFKSIKLDEQYEWSTCNLYELHAFLKDHYLRDSNYYFEYELELLKIAVNEDWIVTIRNKETKKIEGCITAIISKIRINKTIKKMLQINFLCVDKNSRSKGFAPLLINEITRKAHDIDIWQAIYTACKRLPTPFANARTWHRLINVKKLYKVGFSSDSNERPHKLIGNSYLRDMTKKDVPRVTRMLKKYFEQFKISIEVDEIYVRKWLLPRENIIYSYLSDDEDKFVCFCSLPYIHEKSGIKINQAFKLYNIGDSLKDAIMMARNRGFDVYNCTDIGVDEEELVKHKFVKGTGDNNYYLWNWKLSEEIKPKDIGFTLI